ncbi:hypothetical protein [Actinomadura macra]|uniref:hypothetical protein n=1 Tax=Actinomadura macra TaxID=46164 RepID=UPI0012FA5EA7|nr:hypothetical protein [Actinomadura macra]
MDQDRIRELSTTVARAVMDSGTSLLALLGAPRRADLAGALARPGDLDFAVVEGLQASTDSVNEQIGSVSFVRLHLVQAAVVDACRQLLLGEQAALVRARLQLVAGRAFALAARLVFETRDDAAALALYDEAVAAVGRERAFSACADPFEPDDGGVLLHRRYRAGTAARGRAAVQDARRGESVLMRARARALEAKMAARGDSPEKACSGGVASGVAGLGRRHHRGSDG